MTAKLYKGSLVFFVGTIAGGAGGYLYQLFMGRMLSLEEFGTLAALIGFFAIAVVPVGALTIIATQLVATHKAQSGLGAVRYLTLTLSKAMLWAGLGLGILFAALFPLFNGFLRLESGTPYFLYASYFLLAGVAFLGKGVLPGLQRFRDLSASAIVENLAKLLLAILFVWLGFGVNGAVGAIVASTAIVLVFIFWRLRDLRAHQVEKIPLQGAGKFFGFVLLWFAATTAMQSMDVLFVKGFFPAADVGLYAGVSLLAKIIFFAATAVSGTLLPMSTEFYEGGQHASHKKLVWHALGLVLAICAAGILVYSISPGFWVKILFGAKYVSFAPYLLPLAIFASLLSIVQLLATYFLSIRKKWFVLALFAALGAEAFLLCRFHANVWQVLYVINGVFLALALVLFIMFLLLTAYEKKHALRDNPSL